MSMHKMNISESALGAISRREKTIEVRLNNGKYNLKVGDEIEFSAGGETAITNVLKIENFSSFEELFHKHSKNLGVSRFASEKEWLDTARQIYSAAEEKKYGVLAIHIGLSQN